MALSITIYVPDDPVTYEIGVSNVSNIQVKYYFANVVDVYIFFDDGSSKRYLQMPCLVNIPAP